MRSRFKAIAGSQYLKPSSVEDPRRSAAGQKKSSLESEKHLCKDHLWHPEELHLLDRISPHP